MDKFTMKEVINALLGVHDTDELVATINYKDDDVIEDILMRNTNSPLKCDNK